MASSELFVGNIPFEVCNHKYIRSLFEQVGPVRWVGIPFLGGKPRGYAFITMADIADNGEAIEHFNGYSLHGRPIVVRVAYSDSAQSDAKGEAIPSNPWDEFVGQAQVVAPNLDTEEINYKTDVAREVTDARAAMLGGDTDWAEQAA